MVSVREVVNEVLFGVIDGLIYVLLYVYIVPLLFDYILSYFSSALSLGTLSQPLSVPLSELIIVIALFEGIGITSRILRGHILGPTLRALGSLLGLIFVLAVVQDIMPNGVIAGSYALSSNSYVTVKVDIDPLLVAFVAALALPGIVTPFIDYFLTERD